MNLKADLIRENLKSAKTYIQFTKDQKQKGQFTGVSDLVPLALAIVSLAIVVGVGALVLNEMDNTTNDNDTSDVLTSGVAALQDFADFFTIIVVIGIAAVIFLLLRVVRRAGGAASA